MFILQTTHNTVLKRVHKNIMSRWEFLWKEKFFCYVNCPVHCGLRSVEEHDDSTIGQSNHPVDPCWLLFNSVDFVTVPKQGNSPEDRPTLSQISHQGTLFKEYFLFTMCLTEYKDKWCSLLEIRFLFL
jgi:hypothetical protein